MDRQDKIRQLTAAVAPWFRANARPLPWREDTDPYHVWVSEIMLQQTRIETVIPYYLRFLREIPDIPTLAGADPERLQKLWEGLGYYSRVRNMQSAARQIVTEYGGVFPQSYEEIRGLCGIGDYTAGAIASICFDLPAPAVDGNVLRVLSRITEDGRPVDGEKIKKEVRAELAECYPSRDRGACTQGIMELGETLCLPGGAPDCGRCPCREFCGSAAGGWALYPVRAEKKARRSEELTVFLLRRGDRIALRKRPERGLLGGLWELPNCPGQLTEDEARRTAAAWGCAPRSLTAGGAYTHIFTHVEWRIRCFAAECGAEVPGFLWVTAGELEREYSLPTAFRKALDRTPE